MACNNDGAQPDSYRKIDPKLVPDSHRFVLKLDDDDDDDLFEFDGLIWMIRTLFSLGGSRVGKKFVACETEDLVIFVTLVQGGVKIHFLLLKYTLEVVAVMGNAGWKIPFDSEYDIEGAERVSISKSYPVDFTFRVGLGELRNFLNAFHGDDESVWGQSFYSLSANFTEVSRFDSLQRTFRMNDSIQLTGVELWLVRNWETVSKAWKLYSRYGVWDPIRLCPLLPDKTVAEKALAVLADVSIGKEIRVYEEEFHLDPVNLSVH